MMTPKSQMGFAMSTEPNRAAEQRGLDDRMQSLQRSISDPRFGVSCFILAIASLFTIVPHNFLCGVGSWRGTRKRDELSWFGDCSLLAHPSRGDRATCGQQTAPMASR
jgi:hypothetical protein